jgi:hypothetical protein
MEQAGDLIYRDPLNVTTRLPRGAAGEFLKVLNASTGALGWGAAMADLTENSGDLMYRAAVGPGGLTRLGRGSVGQVLTSTDSSIGWAALPDTGMTDPLENPGDLIYRTPGGVTDNLPVGSTGEFLKVTGTGAIGWGTGLVDVTSEIGDLLYRSSSTPGSNLTRLGVGTTGQVLTVTGTDTIGWSNSGGMTDPMQLAGDLIYRNTNNVTTRLPVGTTGEFLKVTSTGAIGWGAGMTNVMTNPGDIIYGGTGGAPTRLQIGDPGQQLRVSGTGSLQYFTPSGSVPSGIITYTGFDYQYPSYTIQQADVGKLFIITHSGNPVTGTINLPGAPSVGNSVWISHNAGNSGVGYSLEVASSSSIYYNGVISNPFPIGSSSYTTHFWYSGVTYGWVVLSNSFNPVIP